MTREDFNHQMVLIYRRAAGDKEIVGRVAVTPNLTPAFEAARLEMARAYLLDHRDARMVPAIASKGAWVIWDSNAGPPHCAGLEVAVRGESDASDPANLGVAPHRWRLNRDYFADLARAGASQLVESKKLETGATYHWDLCALPLESTAGASGSDFSDIAEPLPLRPDSLTAHVGRSILAADTHGTSTATGASGGGGEGGLPVFIPQRLLDEAQALAAQSIQAETGGFLLGSHCVDPETGELFVVIEDQVPATHTESEAMKLRFTDQTWTALRSTLRLRRDPAHVRLMGWWHHHPVDAWCLQCPEERRRVCALRTERFFSAQDCEVMRRTFPRASSVGLLLTVREGQTRFDVFGWRNGSIQSTAWHRLDAPSDVIASSDQAPIVTDPALVTTQPGEPCDAPTN